MDHGQINNKIDIETVEYILNKRILDMRALLLRLVNTEVVSLKRVSVGYSWLIDTAALTGELYTFDRVIDKLIADHLDFASNNRIKILAKHYIMPGISRSDHNSRLVYLKDLRRKIVASRINCPGYKSVHREVDEIYASRWDQTGEEAVRAFLRDSPSSGVYSGGTDVPGGWYTTFGSIEEGEGSPS